ncbi:Ribosomal protein S18 acetylase RimI [Streptococcus gallolyticus]|uniref:Ribosomal protein S18 acetylase RimI n=1 Tax=Streptococcus gallolyticus TaxID=315405 RepID=A0A1I7EUZ6_9STRE|nr:GNAT family N-acetyltransferase [Streptococcus gallolyticus]SFB96110.1 Ribosomal protein S18 acetylase RimI [Streptococcus gallolyticus]SFU27765.1 Ribosomal protein S18 acetylase RimI [Streptococcus gallolyticus]
MDIQFKSFTDEDTAQAIAIWNQIVIDGVAFPQTETLTLETGKAFFKAQTYTGVAYQADTGQIVGLYILHPNNVGRCGHICNTSYAVDSHFRGQHIGEKLVRHSMETAKKLGFRILQFNAVVKSNQAALALYQKLGFHQLGTIPAGFLNKNNEYEDIIPHYYDLTKLPD